MKQRKWVVLDGENFQEVGEDTLVVLVDEGVLKELFEHPERALESARRVVRLKELLEGARE